MRSLLTVVALLLFAGCFREIGRDDDRFPDPWVPEPRPFDAGWADFSEPDFDGGSPWDDAGPWDAGSRDAGLPPDAGDWDASLPDGGPAEAISGDQRYIVYGCFEPSMLIEIYPVPTGVCPASSSDQILIRTIAWTGEEGPVRLEAASATETFPLDLGYVVFEGSRPAYLLWEVSDDLPMELSVGAVDIRMGDDCVVRLAC